MRCLGIGALLCAACLLPGPSAADGESAKGWSEGDGEVVESPEAGFVSPWNLGYADFLPQSSASDDCLYDVPSEGNGGYVSADAPGAVCCLVAGVHLPDGATVSSVFFYLRDNSPGDVTLSLRRKRIDDESISTAMGTATTFGTGAGVRIFSDVSIANAVVDNSSYTYYVSTDTCLDEALDLRLVSALLFFSEGS